MSKFAKEITITLERYDMEVVEFRRNHFTILRVGTSIVLAKDLNARELDIFMTGVIAGGAS
jgi:hypothetical protein